jgi:hypothetical protein
MDGRYLKYSTLSSGVDIVSMTAFVELPLASDLSEGSGWDSSDWTTVIDVSVVPLFYGSLSLRR